MIYALTATLAALALGLLIGYRMGADRGYDAGYEEGTEDTVFALACKARGATDDEVWEQWAKVHGVEDSE